MIEYRPMTEEDIPRVIEIENQCFSQPWSAEAMLRELRENAKMARYMVACADGRVVGYGGYWQIFDEAHITNIAVDGEHRRQGIAGEHPSGTGGGVRVPRDPVRDSGGACQQYSGP